MVNASELKNAFNEKLEKIKNTEEFKFAIKRIEKDIAYEAKRGNNSFSYNKCALVKDHKYSSPSREVLNAIKIELEKHGYTFEEYSHMNRAGYYNSCYKVSW